MYLFKNLKISYLLFSFIGIVILQTLLNYGWVWVYSHFIDASGDQAYYEDYIFRNRFWVNLFIALPLYFLASRWLGIKTISNPMGHAITLFSIHLLFSLSTELTMGDIAGYLVEFLLFTLGIFAACYFGGRQAQVALSSVS